MTAPHPAGRSGDPATRGVAATLAKGLASTPEPVNESRIAPINDSLLQVLREWLLMAPPGDPDVCSGEGPRSARAAAHPAPPLEARPHRV